jgi:hypothetical protein
MKQNNAWMMDEGEVVEDGRKSFTLTLKNNILKAAEKMAASIAP